MNGWVMFLVGVVVAVLLGGTLAIADSPFLDDHEDEP